MTQFDDFAERLAAMEERLANLQVGDLPIGPLQKKLEADWHPNGGVLLEPKSVGLEQLQYRTIVGAVTGPGAVLSTGTGGWTVSRTGVGTYVVTFSPEFNDIPAINATIGATGGFTAIKTNPRQTASSATIQTYNSSTGGVLDCEFSFSATGR